MTASVIQGIHNSISQIVPFDALEAEHLAFTKAWMMSGSGLFRLQKPAIPDPHLVSYFLLVDQKTKSVLLADHKKAELWLPTGGHVEPNEDPKETVMREAQEELAIEAEFLVEEPLFLTVTKTQGTVAEHTDVSLWYVLKGKSGEFYTFDPEEFCSIQWFALDQIPYHRTDPHFGRFIQKIKKSSIL